MSDTPIMRTVGKEGIAFNGRCYNHPALKKYLSEAVLVTHLDDTHVGISFEGMQVCIAEAQQAITHEQHPD